MASKKSVKKIENIAIKSADDIAKDIQEIQKKTREALSVIDAAFIEKQAELSVVIELIQEKNRELEETYDKEKVLQSIEDLKEELVDRRHESDREIKRIKLDFNDKKEELERALQTQIKIGKETIQDEQRARRILIEDEERARKIAHEERENELLKQQMQLDERAVELGSFEDRLAKEVGKAKGIAERNAQIEIRQKDTEHKAIVDILESKLQQSVGEINELKLRLQTAETTAKLAQEKSAAIATAALDKEAGKLAMEKVSALASEFASGNKR